jgi:transcriptional regulator with XRE-family HTH domain
MLLRDAVGRELRAARVAQSRTLRSVARDARVSLGYLSEVERGQKEASSELLASICAALNIELSKLLGEVTVQIAQSEFKNEKTALKVISDAA